MKRTSLLKTLLLLCALVAGGQSVWAQKSFKLITSTDELVTGCNYLIVTQEFSNASDPVVAASYYTIGTKNSSTNRKAQQVTVTNNVITTAIGANVDDTNPRMFELKTSAVSGRWNFYNAAETGYLNGGYSSNNHLKIGSLASSESTADGNWDISINSTTGVATIKNQNDWQILMNPNFQGKKGSKTFTTPLMASYGSGSYTNVCLYREVVPATFATGKTMISYSDANNALDLTTAGLPSGFAAYKVTAADQSSVTLTPVNAKVKKNTGLILTSTAGNVTYYIPVVADADATNISGTNLLVATDGTSSVSDAAVLSGGAFHPLSEAGVIAAGKAYLPYANIEGGNPFAGSTPAPSLEIIFANGAETTGINSIENGELRMENFFDLQGRRVAQPKKGLYIVNGKKVVIK